jgi:hypothetical protein
LVDLQVCGRVDSRRRRNGHLVLADRTSLSDRASGRWHRLLARRIDDGIQVIKPNEKQTPSTVRPTPEANSLDGFRARDRTRPPVEAEGEQYRHNPVATTVAASVQPLLNPARDIPSDSIRGF